MKSLVLSLMFLVLSANLVTAATATSAGIASSSATTRAGQVRGLYDDFEDDIASSTSASPAATPVVSTRSVAYLDPSKAPASGATENTIILLSLGVFLIITGVKINERLS